MKNLTNRRSFLGAAAALATGGALPATAARHSPAGALKLGVATYSLRKFDRAQAIEMLKKLRVHYISIKSFHLPYSGSAAETKAGADEFRKAGFEVLSGGNIDLKQPDKNRAMFEYAKAAGLPMMVCAPEVETLDQCEDLVKEFNIRMAIHNHGPEDKHFPTPDSVFKQIKNRDPRIGLCVDIGHTTRTSTNVLESIRRCAPRVFSLHAKDLANLMEKKSQVAVGRGAMPIVGLFKLLKTLNYQGGVMLEYEIKPDDPLPGMIESLSYMRGVLDGLAG